MVTLIEIGIVGLLLAGLWYGAEHWCNSVCHDARSERDGLLAAVALAKQQKLEQVTRWDEERQRADKAEEANAHARDVLFRTLVDSARRLPDPVAHTVFPAAAVGVLNDAIRAGESSLAPAAGQPQQAAATPAADSDVGAITEWGVTCIAYYDAALERVDAIRSFYNGLRASQLKEAP